MSLTELVNLMVDSDLVAQRATLRERAGDGSATDTAP
jgi:hypothetical protein